MTKTRLKWEHVSLSHIGLSAEVRKVAESFNSLPLSGIEAASVGNLNTFGVKCHVTQELTLENRCVIGERGLSLETPSPCSVAGDV